MFNYVVFYVFSREFFFKRKNYIYYKQFQIPMNLLSMEKIITKNKAALNHQCILDLKFINIIYVFVCWHALHYTFTRIKQRK